MSDPPQTFHDSRSDLDIIKGFAVAGAVVFFFMIVLFLRLFCYQNSFTEKVEQIWKNYFPQRNSRNNLSRVSTEDEISMDRLLQGLSPIKKQMLVSTVLTSQVASQQDLTFWITRKNDEAMERMEDNDFSNLLCPICIQQVETGDSVVSLKVCQHVFHTKCLSQWLSTHTRDCPYCRTEILTDDMLQEAYRIRKESTWVD